MKFLLFAASLPVLATAASVAQRAEKGDSKLPIVDIGKPGFSGKANNAQKLEFSSKSEAVAAGSWWCSYGFWCDDSSPSCCKYACCGAGANICGSDGNCYIVP